ncbi:MAG: diacylglycerol kinase [Dictyoglomus sp. NZ13-RE01]|nr:MAG: diacylglycerol kinase [Dictyoglomus sp. NZ13-RE01]
MKYHVLVNPIANKGRGEKLFPEIKSLLEKENINFDIEFTLGGEGTLKQVEKALDKGADIVVAAGGDGTVNEVVNGLRGRAKLGILPIGRGNDVARSLKIPKNLKEAVKLLKKGKNFKMDLGMIDGRYFVGVTGLGFDAEANLTANRLKFRGPLGYVASVFLTLKNYKPKKCNIYMDDKVWSGEITLVAIGNTRNYAGGMKITPSARLNDGLFDICIVEKIHPLELVLYFPLIYFGKHTINPHVKMYRAKEVKIEGEKDLMATMDGELIPAEKLVVKNIPNIQDVICGGVIELC